MRLSVFLITIYLFLLSWQANAEPPYCSQQQDDCHKLSQKTPLNELSPFIDVYSGDILTKEKFEGVLQSYALMNLLEQAYRIKSLYPELPNIKIPEQCNGIIRSKPELKSAITHLKKLPPDLEQRKKLENKIKKDFTESKQIWDRVPDIQKDLSKIQVHLVLLSQKKMQVQKSLLFLGDKKLVLDKIESEIEQYIFLQEQNKQKLEMAFSIVAKNPLLIEPKILAGPQSIHGIGPSKIYRQLEEKHTDFSKAMDKNISTIKSSLKNICSGKSKLHHHQALVDDILLQRALYHKSTRSDPSYEQSKIQQIHCALWKEDPPGENQHKYLTLATTGIFLTGLVLTPFTGGASLGMALLWTAGIGSTVLGSMQTYESWQKTIDSKALYMADLSDAKKLSEDYDQLRTDGALLAVDIGLYSFGAQKLITQYRIAKGTYQPSRQFVHSFSQFKRHTKLHIKRVEKIGMFIYDQHPEQFKNINKDLAKKFLRKHDQGKVNFKLWKDIHEKPIIKEIYKYYNVPKEKITAEQFAKMKSDIDKLNAMDAKVAQDFFEKHHLIQPDGKLSETAKELLHLEHLSDLVDRGKNIVSTEEFAKKAMIPASKMFKSSVDATLASEAESQYKQIIHGLDYTDNALKLSY